MTTDRLAEWVEYHNALRAHYASTGMPADEAAERAGREVREEIARRGVTVAARRAVGYGVVLRETLFGDWKVYALEAGRRRWLATFRNHQDADAFLNLLTKAERT